jgi:hypothetical protein
MRADSVRKPQPISAATAKDFTLETVYTLFNIYKPWLSLFLLLRGFFLYLYLTKVSDQFVQGSGGTSGSRYADVISITVFLISPTPCSLVPHKRVKNPNISTSTIMKTEVLPHRNIFIQVYIIMITAFLEFDFFKLWDTFA